MNAPRVDKVPRLVVWYGHAIFYFGVLCFPLAIVLSVGSYLSEGGDILSSLLTVVDVWGMAAAICGFGIAVSHGAKSVLMVLLVIIVFGCGLVGFLFTVGRNPELGYYLWAGGGFASLSLVLILTLYWGRLPP
jgi:hypothetical protein